MDESYSFFTLPPELRLKVYGFLAGKDDVPPTDNDSTRQFSNDVDGPRPKVIMRHHRGGLPSVPMSASLLRTCSLIYQEFMPVLYQGSTVYAEAKMDLAYVLKQIGQNGAGRIQHIVIKRVPNYCTMEYFYAPFGKVAVNEDMPKRPLPPLTSLKTVLIKCEEPYYNYMPMDNPPCMTTVKQLVASGPNGENFLTDYKKAFRGCPDATWRMEILYRNHYLGYTFEWAVCVQVEVQMVVDQDDDECAKNWKLVDASDNAISGCITPWKTR